jgi:FkbM family methyltransferase
VERLVPDVTGFHPELARRMVATVSCPDADAVPKVPHAGECRGHNGQRVQIMHNGLLVEEGGYYGAWMAETIRALRGHHEPQEEVVFHHIIERLAADGGTPAMIEFGSYWTYYGLWFCHAIPTGHVVALEPDPAWLDVGRRNAALNSYGDRIRFVHAAIGEHPGDLMAFTAESDSRTHHVPQHDLASLMAATDLPRVDLILADVQGAETILIERARAQFDTGRVRFMVVSTHHHSISGDPLTHQNALKRLTDAGAHVIAEHSVGESVSGDGLIAVSFDPRDKDMRVPVSHARYRESLFGELEHDLAAATAALTDAEQATSTAAAEAETVRAELAHMTARRDQAQAQLAAVYATKTWRWAKKPRELYARAIKHR